MPLELKAIWAIVFHLCIQNKNKTHLNKFLKWRKHKHIRSLNYSNSQGQRLYSLYPQCLEHCLEYSKCSVNTCWISQSINTKVKFLFLSRSTFVILDGTVLTCEIVPCTLQDRGSLAISLSTPLDSTVATQNTLPHVQLTLGGGTGSTLRSSMWNV